MERLTVEANTTGITCPYTVSNNNQLIVNLISNIVVFYFTTYCCIALNALVSSLGVATNIINIIVYCKQGIGESVNITFITLSVWDLAVSFLSLLSSMGHLVNVYFTLPSIDIMGVLYVYIAYTRGCMYVLSTLVTVYLSIERCVCIKLPFKVKDIFTVKSAVLTNLLIFVFGLACFCPAWATQRLQLAFDPRYNRERVILWLSSNRRDINLFVDTFNGMVIPLLALILITINACFMIKGINESSKIRQLHIHLGKSRPIVTLTTPNSLKIIKTMSSKDVKLTKVVLLLAFIFFACNVPVFIVALLRALIPDIDVDKQRNLYTVLFGVVYLCGIIHSSINICVYYNASSRYKRELKRLFGLGAPRE